ncbi:hypothetical protein BH10PSE7_BH10PSE7_00890 [soil metagenome]
MSFTITYKNDKGLQKLQCETAARAVGEYLLGGLSDPALEAVIHKDGFRRAITVDQLGALAIEKLGNHAA